MIDRSTYLSAASGDIRAASLWFLNRRTILDVMVSANIYPIQDESPFVEREENYEIYREIYGDPIYDVYEDDVRVVDFVFSEDSFTNLVCAKIMQQEIRAKLVEDGFRAKIRQDSNCANFGQIRRFGFVQNSDLKINF